MAKSYVNFNKEVLTKGLTIHVKGVVAPKLLDILKKAAEYLMKSLDNDIPIYTGNLHDSTGVGIYNDGRLTSFIPNPKADPVYDKQRSGFGGKKIYNIVGRDCLEDALKMGSSRFTKGIWFVVFSTVPYAYYIDKDGSPLGRGQNFFKLAVEDVTHLILAGLRPIASDVSTSIGTSL